MTDGVSGIDPAGLRALGDAATALAAAASATRGRAAEIAAAAGLAAGADASLAELASELELLAALCRGRAAAIEEAAAGWGATMRGLGSSLGDGAGSDGMTAPLALETLRLHRAVLDTDGDGVISAGELRAAGGADVAEVRAAAAFLQDPPGPHAAVAVLGQHPSTRWIGRRPPIEEQVATVNTPLPRDLDGMIAGWAADASGHRPVAFTVRVDRDPLTPAEDAFDLLGAPATEALVAEPVPVPELDPTWLLSLGDLAPAATAAIVVRYRAEEVDFAYTVDPVPALPEWLTPVGLAGTALDATVSWRAPSIAARLNPFLAGAGVALGVYGTIDYFTSDAEPRQDTTVIFDVEYRDRHGRVVRTLQNMALQRTEVARPLFGGPAVVVVPHRRAD